MSATDTLNDKAFYLFGEFRLDMRQRVLFRGKKPLALAPKVFDTLAFLVENHGRLIDKDELMNQIWADSYVEENNLAHNIRTLRKTLGDNARQPVYIETVARRGYRFIHAVEKIAESTAPEKEIIEAIPAAKVAENLPETNFGAVQATNLVEQNRTPQNFSADKSKNERNYLISAIVAVCAVGAIGLAIWFLQKNFFSPASSRAKADVSSFDAATFKAEKLANVGNAGHTAISPDGKLVAYTNAVGDKHSLWLRQLATATSAEIVPPAAGIFYGLRFSRGGDYLYFVRGGEQKPTELFRLPVVGGVPVKIAEDVQGWFSIAPDDRQISFIKNRPNRTDWSSLIIANADGTNERTVATRGRPVEISAHDFSPDGQRIIAAVGQSHTGDRESRLIEFNVADGAEREVSPHRWFYIKWLAWAANQNQIVLTGREELSKPNQIWRVALPGGEARQITKDSADYSDVSLSADGRQMLVTQMTLNSFLSIAPAERPDEAKRLTAAFGGLAWLTNEKIVYSTHAVGGDALWTMNADGGEQRQLTFDEPGSTSPSAVPGKDFVVYVSDSAGIHHIWRVNADGSNKLQLTNDAGEQAPTISPDGNTVFYHTVGEAQSAIWKVSTDGGEPVRAMENYGFAPAVSPDGKRLAYFLRQALENDRWQIVVTSLEAEKSEDQTFEIAGGSLSVRKIRWTIDSKNIAYATETNQAANTWLQPTAGGEPRQLTSFSTEQIFDFGWSPDGKRFAVIRGAWNNEVLLLLASD